MSITVVLDNIRSAYNVGSIARTCDGLGVEGIITYGITPHPLLPNDQRLPHISAKATRSIAKTALGAEQTITHHAQSLEQLLPLIDSVPIVCLEQTKQSQPLRQFRPSGSIALVVGNEINGVSVELLEIASTQLYIPMRGQKESFNVAVATAIALYDLLNR